LRLSHHVETEAENFISPTLLKASSTSSSSSLSSSSDGGGTQRIQFDSISSAKHEQSLLKSQRFSLSLSLSFKFFLLFNFKRWREREKYTEREMREF